MKKIVVLLIGLIALLPAKEINDYGWLIGIRAASVPYKTDHSDNVMISYLPLMWFEGERLFFRATQAGVHLYKNDYLEINALAKLRFVDMPRSSQEYFSSDVIDTGLGVRWHDDSWGLSSALYQDGYARYYVDTKLFYSFEKKEAYHLEPYLLLSYRDKAFNSFYYGLDEDLDADLAYETGVELSLNISEHAQLYSSLKMDYLGKSAADAKAIDSPLNYELIAGVRLGAWNKSLKKLKNDPFIRVGFGVATLGSFSEILTLSAPSDPYANKMVSLFYGHPLDDDFLGYDLPLYLISGAAYHFKSQVQNQAIEGVSAFKVYFPLWNTFRLGLATGFSYISETTYVENWANEKDGYEETSQFMNHLDLSLDYQISKDITLGYSIFHRSGIFESVQSFGQIKGGSNYHQLYLQYNIGAL
ncbi:MAG: MipA/OmpV family protein [Campylobacterota bacterium]|nr:MipA/OmpV family protein [Campylobacterota bacterium]